MTSEFSSSFATEFAGAAGLAAEVEIYCPPNATKIWYAARNRFTGAVKWGSVNSDLPTVNTGLQWRVHTRNNATAASAYIYFGNDWLMHP